MRLALHRARAYRQLGDREAELAIMKDILPHVGVRGYEGIAAELYARFAQLKREGGCPAEEALKYFQTAAGWVRYVYHNTRNRPRDVSEGYLEEELAHLRAELG